MATETHATAEPDDSDERTERRRPGSGTARFGREVTSELRKTVWPTRSQLLTYTGVVLVFLVLMITLLGLVDAAVSAAMLKILG